MEGINHHFGQRRLRSSPQIRELSASIHLSHKSFIQPLFVNEDLTQPAPIKALNGMQSDTKDSVLQTIQNDLANGITKFLLFPVPAKKAVDNFDFSFAVKTAETIKHAFGDQIWLAVDLCLCSYTTHGHCGILNEKQTKLLNNETVEILSKYASQLANAGVDCIAPSDMMDGRIAAIRSALNDSSFDHVGIMSYAAKFSSQFYGPFRDACNSTPNSAGLKNRKTYQISPTNLGDAIASSLRDDKEGADILMIKPAALYTDVIAALRSRSSKPLAAYHVSGEYASIEHMVQLGFMERREAHLEVWTALMRSGANMIISYAARNAKAWIDEMAY